MSRLYKWDIRVASWTRRRSARRRSEENRRGKRCPPCMSCEQLPLFRPALLVDFTSRSAHPRAQSQRGEARAIGRGLPRKVTLSRTATDAGSCCDAANASERRRSRSFSRALHRTRENHGNNTPKEASSLRGEVPIGGRCHQSTPPAPPNVRRIQWAPCACRCRAKAEVLSIRAPCPQGRARHHACD